MEKEQESLLVLFAEAARNMPSSKRQPFMMRRNMQTGAMADLAHPGIPGGHTIIYPGDVEELVEQGLVRFRDLGHGNGSIEVTSEGFATYRELKEAQGEPTLRVEAARQTYLGSIAFRARFPGAAEKWEQAESLLWSADSSSQYTAIGHHCREAMQLLVTELAQLLNVTLPDADPAHTVARLREVIRRRATSLPGTLAPLLDTLVDYWGCVSDLAQRQEHGAQREKEELVWNDARRLVFVTAYVMHELANALSES